VFQQYGGGPDESRIVANRGGHLRLGIELMKGALAVPAGTHGPQNTPVDIEYLISEESCCRWHFSNHRTRDRRS
jgi:hypothetical protein